MTLTLEDIRANVIGDGTLVDTAFGQKPIIYADYVASGRALAFVEDYIAKAVLPYYANTHTETSFTGRQTSHLRHEAREIIRNAVGGTEDHSVIFCGSGATAAIHKLIDILNLRLPHDLAQRYQLDEHIPADERPVVFIGPYEHHSNELPWRECIADVVSIPLNDKGTLDQNALATELDNHKHRKVKVGSFSAASNVTGIRSDVAGISSLLHAYDALAFWDYAAAGPYVSIDMTGDPSRPGSHLDAVFLSPHKFIGGPGTPGVLVVTKQLCQNTVPTMPGGGTVCYVTPEKHRFVDDPERREEGGTPGIVESIRAGCVFQIQHAIGLDVIEDREASFTRRAMEHWSHHPNMTILGNTEVERLSIFSMRIHWQGQDLHYSFVVALLNDLFGIQARGGCSCAGPYGHTLLNLTAAESQAIEERIQQGEMVLRPGWTRLGFNYFMSEDVFLYILKAVDLIAHHGWRLLPSYHYDTDQGVWLFEGKRLDLPSSLDQLCDVSSWQSDDDPSPNHIDYEALLSEAEHIMTRQRKGESPVDFRLSHEAQSLCWFVMPQEAHNKLQQA